MCRREPPFFSGAATCRVLDHSYLSAPAGNNLREDHPPVREGVEAWPPSWFGGVRSERPDTAARTEEILHAELGLPESRRERKG